MASRKTSKSAWFVIDCAIAFVIVTPLAWSAMDYLSRGADPVGSLWRSLVPSALVATLFIALARSLSDRE